MTLKIQQQKILWIYDMCRVILKSSNRFIPATLDSTASVAHEEARVCSPQRSDHEYFSSRGWGF